MNLLVDALAKSLVFPRCVEALSTYVYRCTLLAHSSAYSSDRLVNRIPTANIIVAQEDIKYMAFIYGLSASMSVTCHLLAIPWPSTQSTSKVAV